MGISSILRGFGLMLLVLAAAMMVPFGVALMFEPEYAGGYAFGAILSAVVGLGALLSCWHKKSASDLRGGLVCVMLWWGVVPIFAMVPFHLGPSNMPLGDALFETVSALTTTGAWLDFETAISSKTEMIWRALMQWLGGLASLSIAAALFIRPAFIGIDTMLPPFSRGEHASYLRAMRNAFKAFLPAYAGLSAFGVVALMLAGAPFWDACVMALSFAATGGFVPNADGIGAYAPVVGGLAFVMMIVGGMSFVVISRWLAGGKTLRHDAETIAYASILIFAGVMFWVLTGSAGGVGGLFAQWFNAAGLLSTNGIVIGTPPTLAAAGVTAIIGGTAVSTAGGFKVLRWLVINRRAREEIRKLVSPNAVFGTSRIADEFGVWTHFLVFTIILAILLLSFSLAGYSFDVATIVGVAALSNSGPLLALAAEGSANYDIFDGPLRLLLIAAMILGRLEAVVALALLNRAFWRN